VETAGSTVDGAATSEDTRGTVPGTGAAAVSDAGAVSSALSPASIGACDKARCLEAVPTVRRMPVAVRRRAMSPHDSLM